MIGIAVAAALGAAGSGYALGGYATGGSKAEIPTDTQDRASFWTEDAADRAKVDPSPLPEQSAAATPGPDHYVCKGCGPTLAERRAQEVWSGGPAEAAYAAPEEIYPAGGL